MVDVSIRNQAIGSAEMCMDYGAEALKFEVIFFSGGHKLGPNPL